MFWNDFPRFHCMWRPGWERVNEFEVLKIVYTILIPNSHRWIIQTGESDSRSISHWIFVHFQRKKSWLLCRTKRPSNLEGWKSERDSNQNSIFEIAHKRFNRNQVTNFAFEATTSASLLNKYKSETFFPPSPSLVFVRARDALSLCDKGEFRVLIWKSWNYVSILQKVEWLKAWKRFKWMAGWREKLEMGENESHFSSGKVPPPLSTP